MALVALLLMQTAEGYTAYADITEAQAIGWVKDSMGEEAVTALEDSIAAQIADSLRLLR